jgi:hypothetical protein
MAVGRRLNDPRSSATALALLAWVALVSDDYVAALRYTEESHKVALTLSDRIGGMNGRAVALVLLRRPEGDVVLREVRNQCISNGWHWYLTGSDPAVAILAVLRGRIHKGIRLMEKAIAARESDGYQAAADWYRLLLCDLYLEIITGKEKPPTSVLLKNLPILIYTITSVRMLVE